MPKKKVPPDKDGVLVIEKEESELADHHDVMDIERFESRSLTQPSNLSLRQSVQNLKMVVQGKYLNDNQTATTSKAWKRDREIDGSSSRESDIPLPPRRKY